MRKTPAIFLLILILFAPSISCAEQLNPRLSGAIEDVAQTNDYYVAAGSDVVYVFTKGGALQKFLTIGDISDFALSDDLLIITTYSKEFPNVRAYSFPELAPLWTFEPKMDVFDQNLVWHTIQPRSWQVKIMDGKIGVLSGYSFYLLDREGNVLSSFSAENDIWDVTKYSEKYYLSSQNGDVYILDSSLNLIEKKKICDSYTLVDLVTNNTKGTYARSVWQVESLDGRLYAACEDGNLYSLDDKRKIEFAAYPESVTYSYYLQRERQTGFGDQYFRNIEMKKDGNIMLLRTSDTLGAIKDSMLLWSEDIKPIGEACIHNKSIYVQKKYSNKKEFVYVYSLETGEKEGELIIDSIPYQSGGKLFCYEGGFLSTSPYEVKFVDYEGNISWSYPRLGTFEPVVAGDKLILLADTRESFMNEHAIYYILAVKDNTVLWQYAPEEGYISDVKISGNRMALAVSDGDDRLVVIDIETGNILLDAAPTSRVYAGILDTYLLNETIMDVMKTFNYSDVDYIPYEVWTGDVENAVKNHGIEAVDFYMQALSRLPLDREILWNFRSFDIKHISDLELKRDIQKIDMCDLNNDNTADILVSLRDYLVLIDGSTLKELWLADAREWRYENDFNRDYKGEFIKKWYDDDYVALCAGDVDKNGYEDLLLYRYDKYKLLLGGRNSTYAERFSESVENLAWESVGLFEDVNNDGYKDLFMANWNENAPETISIIDLTDNKEIQKFQSNGRRLFMRPGLYDANGDGNSETAIIYEHDGAILKLFSEGYEWTYEEMQDFWDVWSKYRYMSPFEVYNGELIVGIKNKNEDGIKILRRNAGDGKISVLADVEQAKRNYDSREWGYVVDMRVKGDVAFMATPAMPWQGGKGKMVAYDLKEGKIKAALYDDVRRIVVLDERIMYLTVDGKIITRSISGDLEVKTDVDDYVTISWNKDGHARVYVNDVLSASVSGKEVKLRLSNGEHEIKVALLDENNFEEYSYAKVDVFNPSNLFILNIILGILLVIIIGARLWLRR